MSGLKVGRDFLTRHSDRFTGPLIGGRWGGGGRLDGGDHAERSLEQRPSHRAETSAEAKGRLGDPGSASVGAPSPRPRFVYLAIDSKLRGCDLVRLLVDDVCAGGRVRDRATVIQKKTGRPVQFEITEQTRSSIRDWLPAVDARKGQYLFPSRSTRSPTYRHANMRGSSTPGSRALGLKAPPTARIR